MTFCEFSLVHNHLTLNFGIWYLSSLYTLTALYSGEQHRTIMVLLSYCVFHLSRKKFKFLSHIILPSLQMLSTWAGLEFRHVVKSSIFSSCHLLSKSHFNKGQCMSCMILFVVLFFVSYDTCVASYDTCVALYCFA